MKICSVCKKEKSLSEYSRQKSVPLILCSKCKACYRSYYQKNILRIAENRKRYYNDNKERLIKQNIEYRLRNPEKQKRWRINDYKKQRIKTLRECFGITLEQHSRMFKDQQGKCAICNRDESKFSKSFAVDHDHKTGKVRGLLCGPCNRGLGCFQESEDILRLAFEYLLKGKVILQS